MPDPDSVEQTDIELGATLASQKGHPWVRSLVKVGNLGDQEPLYAASALAVLLGLLTWNRHRARLGVAMLLAVAAADAGKRVTKGLVRRTRPHVLLDEGRYDSDAGGSPAKPEQSFPSGHVACTVAAARAISRRHPSAGPWTAGFTIAVALARMAKGDHWPLDVVAGAILGLIAEESSSLLLSVLSVAPHRNREP